MSENNFIAATEISPPNALPTTCKSYKVGTLVYTKRVLLEVLFWMLWGDFCVQIMEQVQYIIPLQLKWQGASDRTVGLLTGTLVSIITIVFNPVVAMQSDRHRGQLGRRRPFLLWYTPLLVIALILLGYSELIGRSIHNIFVPIFGDFSQASITIVFIGIFAGMFYLFNTYVFQVYQYLFADVIPQEMMGKFIGFYRAIGAVSMFIFNRYMFGYTEQHTSMVYICIAVFFGIAFMLLVWRVKEGQYPPPEAASCRQTPINLFKIYIKECFSITFYLKLYSIALFFWASFIPFMTFIVFFATDTGRSEYVRNLGMSIDGFGKLKGWTFIIQIPLFFIVGSFVDRFHPLRVIIVGLSGISISYLLGFLFVNSASSLLVFWLFNAAATAIFLAAYLAMFPRILPLAKYGQFFSANQIYWCAGILFAPAICGWLLDILKNYKYLFLWSGCSSLLALWTAIAVYNHWRHLGGDKSYSPP